MHLNESSVSSSLDRIVALLGFALSIVSALANTIRARLIGLTAIGVTLLLWYLVRRYYRYIGRWSLGLVVFGTSVLIVVAPRVVSKASDALPEASPYLALTLDARNASRDETIWSPQVVASPGDTVEFLLSAQNEGESVLNDITARVVSPPHLTIVEESVLWIDAEQEAKQEARFLLSGGYNLGSYAPDGGFFIRFAAVVIGEGFEGCEVAIRALAFVSSNEVREREAPADLAINRCGAS